jgi:hypothetical protein
VQVTETARHHAQLQSCPVADDSPGIPAGG